MSGTTGVWTMPKNPPEPPNGMIGDKVGYVVVKQDRWGGWDETNSAQMDTISQGVGMVRRYQDDDPKGTYAVARLELVMISRPEVNRGND